MKKFSAVIILFLYVQCSFSQTKLSLTIAGNTYKSAYFAGLSGSRMEVFGFKPFQGNTVTFLLQGNLIKGMYRIGMSDSTYFDIIGGNDKEIVLYTHSSALIDSLKVIEGDENKDYYNYIHYKNAALSNLSEIADSFKKKYGIKKSNQQAEERLTFIKGCVTYSINEYALDIVKRNPNRFSSKIIKALLVPNLNLYTIEHHDTIAFDNETEFLMKHFFDNIDFSDSAMLNTEILYRSVKYYIEKLAMPRNVTGFNFANSFILSKASRNDKVYNYVLSLLFDLYEISQLEEVYVKLFDENLSINKNAVTEKKYSDIAEKVSVIKNALAGKTGNNFTTVDSTGKIVQLTDLKKEPLLMFFYASNDKRSEELFLKLEDVYAKNKEKGLEIFAVCTDSLQGNWVKFLRKHKKANWINVKLTDESRNMIATLYNTWALPSIYLIDKSLKIIFKPMTLDYLQKEYPEVFTVK